MECHNPCCAERARLLVMEVHVRSAPSKICCFTCYLIHPVPSGPAPLPLAASDPGSATYQLRLQHYKEKLCYVHSKQFVNDNNYKLTCRLHPLGIGVQPVLIVMAAADPATGIPLRSADGKSLLTVEQFSIVRSEPGQHMPEYGRLFKRNMLTNRLVRPSKAPAYYPSLPKHTPAQAAAAIVAAAAIGKISERNRELVVPADLPRCRDCPIAHSTAASSTHTSSKAGHGRGAQATAQQNSNLLF